MIAFLKSLLALAAVLGVVVAAVWGLVVLVGLKASLIWTAILGGIAWLVRHEVEKKRELTRLLSERKREQYEKFQDFVLSNMGTSDGDAPGVDPQMYRQWSLRLSLVGSDEVVKAWNVVRLFAYEDPPQETEEEKKARMLTMFRVWGDLLLEMRKDAGHADTKLKRSDLYATFVNDIAQYREGIDA